MSDSDVPLPGAEDLLCFLVHSTGAAFNRAYRKPLERLGLTYPQYLVMLTLWTEDALTVGQVGERLRQDSNTLTPILKRLESIGYVTRTRSATDERRVVVQLTAAGSRLRQDAAEVLGCVRGAVGFSDAEIVRLMECIRSLRDNLDAAAAADRPR